MFKNLEDAVRGSAFACVRNLCCPDYDCLLRQIVCFKKVHKDAVIPTKAHKNDSGFDLHSVEDVELKPMERKIVKTGLVWEAEHQELQVRPRSGLAIKYGITVLNSPGTVDASYRGEIGVILINLSTETYNVKKGDKIAQAVIAELHYTTALEIEEVGSSERNNGGFGSTGK